MKSSVILDYHLATGRVGYVVRALLKFHGGAPAETGRLPLNLALVLDRSGSMSGAKLHYAKVAAAFLVRRLRPEDVVSVVAYDDTVLTVAEPAKGDAQTNLPREIEQIRSGGSTNLSGGWLRGRELVARFVNRDGSGESNDVPDNGGNEQRTQTTSAESNAGRANRVLLLTDGLANVGITDPSQLVGLCRNAREHGITTSTIGFGEDYDEELLRGMAEAGGGHSYYIEDADQAPGVFEEEIEGLLSLAAQNIEVKIAPEATVELVKVYNDYPAHGDASGITVGVGDLYAREPKSLLIEFFVPPQAGERIASIAVTAAIIREHGGIEHQEIIIPVEASLTGERHEEAEIVRTQVLLDAARAREEARRRGREGDLGGAARVLHEAGAAVRACKAYDPSFEEQAEDLQEMAALYDSRKVSPRDEKYLYQRAYNARRGKQMYEEKISRKRPKR